MSWILILTFMVNEQTFTVNSIAFANQESCENGLEAALTLKHAYDALCVPHDIDSVFFDMQELTYD